MVIASKDEEIATYRQAIEELGQQAAASQIDEDKRIIVSLRRELQEKNEHVESLEKQLQDVSNEMKDITEQIENIKQQADKGQFGSDVFKFSGILIVEFLRNHEGV
jgi:chromosome segregation ATPase